MFSIGDKVTPLNTDGVPAACLGRIYTVRKINKVNLSCDADDGGRGISFPPHLLTAATEDTLNAGLSIGRPYVPREFFPMGTIVTLKRAWRDWSPDTPLVVIADKGQRVNVTLLGGNEDRYLRTSPESLVTRDMAWLTEHLLEAATAA